MDLQVVCLRRNRAILERCQFRPAVACTMLETSVTISSSADTQARISSPAFLLQVSRPGLWTTTALSYLMPLGHSNFFYSAIFWIGLFFVLFPLGLLLYGVNDIVDAEADLINPRKGTFLFGSRGTAAQLAALRWEIGVAVVVRCATPGCRDV